jgi:nicotinamide riboside kinase
MPTNARYNVYLNTHPHTDWQNDDNQHMGLTKAEAEPVKKLVTECDSLATRLDAFEKRRSMKRPEKVKPRSKDNMQPSNPHPKEPGA